MWTLIVWGLIAIPGVGMLVVVADLFNAYRDLVIVRLWGTDPIAHEQAKHTLYAQGARAGVLVTIAVLAGFELGDILSRELMALLIYVIALLGVGDAWRARRARKRMVRLLNQGDTDG